MEAYYGLVEFFIAVLFVGAWAILEWQGRRLDRAKAAREAEEKDGSSTSSSSS